MGGNNAGVNGVTKSLLEQEYNKELRRIKRFIKRNEKRGFTFNTKMPERPKRITRGSIRRLKRITPSALYSKAKYYDESKGKWISGKLGVKVARKKAAEAGAAARKAKRVKAIKKQALPRQTDLVLRNLEDVISEWSPRPAWGTGFTKLKERDKNIAQRILEGAIQELGRDAVARNAEHYADILQDLLWEILYSYYDESKGKDIQVDLIHFNSLIRGRALSLLETINLQREVDEYLEVD